jgi:queuosine precursor transporter
MIGFIITTRDYLHDQWHGSWLPVRMGLLIFLGSIVSYAVNADVAKIAIASSLAFALSETVNAIVYHPLLKKGVPWLTRVNIGNAPNAITDSLVFVTLAFGWMPIVILLQILAKVAGGLLWSIAYTAWKEQKT